MNSILERANQISDEIIGCRRQIHQHPELAFDLKETVKLVTEKLKEFGYKPWNPCEGAVAAIAGDPKKGKVLLLRADMDALPIPELTDLEFKSENGRTHACGHDIHTAMLLGAAKIIKEHEEELDGAVKFIFQPAEEVLKGAEKVIENGILENPKVDAAFGMHVAPDHPAYTFAGKPEYVMATASEFVIDIKGRGCHGGAFIHLGIDPINVGVHIHLGLQELIAREVKTIEPAVLSIGAFHAGSTTNSIPDTCQMKGTVRSYNPDVQNYLMKRIKEVAARTAEAYNATAEVTYLTAVPALYNNPELYELAAQTVKEVGNFPINFRQSLGCEDFAFYAQKVPSTFMWVGAAEEDETKRFSFHNPRVTFDERCIPVGVATYVQFTLNWFKMI